MTRKRTLYTQAFRQQALAKVYSRGSQSIDSVAQNLNMNHWTLKNWIAADKPSSQVTSENQRPQDHSASERLNLLMESHALSDADLAAFCRTKGLFPHHLKQWREDFETQTSARANRSEVKALKTSYQSLERELVRKEKALAEAAALLVLQKKFQAFWEDAEK